METRGETLVLKKVVQFILEQIYIIAIQILAFLWYSKYMIEWNSEKADRCHKINLKYFTFKNPNNFGSIQYVMCDLI